MTQKDEIAALRAEVAALKTALSGKEDKPPPKKEFVEPPYQRYDPTANMRMPDSALRAMVEATPTDFLRDVVRDNRGPSTPTGTIPSSQQSASPRPSAGDGTGWGAASPLSPPPGLRYVDQQIDAQDQRDRAELIEREVKVQAMETMREQTETMRQQTEALAKLAEPNK